MPVGILPGQIEVSVPSSIPTSINSLVKFTSNAELDKIEEKKVLSLRLPEPHLAIDDLAIYIRNFFNGAKVAKQEVENKMLAILRQIKGEYDADKLAGINSFGGSTDFIRLTQQKVRDTESWIIDIIDPYGDRTWDIEATPISDIPDEIYSVMKDKLRAKMMQDAMQQAAAQEIPLNSEQLLQQMKLVEKGVAKILKKKVQEFASNKAVNMRTKILDQLEEGGWNAASRSCVNDLSRLKSCIMKGPVYKNVVRLSKWEQFNDGKWKPIVSTEAIPTYNRVSPFDWYPAAKSDHVNKGDAIEVEHIGPIDLERMIGVSGYNDEVIKRIINDLPNGFEELTPIKTQRDDLEKDHSTIAHASEISYDMLNYWGIIPGKMLIKSGVKFDKGSPIIPGKYYSVNVKTINDLIIKTPVINPDPLGRKPYDVASFIKNNDSQWGDCPAELMTDIQSICNAAVRALLNNIAIASGPLTEMDQDRLAPGETGEIWPWKRILTTNKKMQEGKAVNFYQAKLLAAELLGVYEKFKKEADDIVVPSFGRTDMGGAGRTSSGLALIMGAAARNIKLAVNNFDQDIVIPKIQKTFDSNMLFIDDPSIKGDIRIKVRGTSGVIAKEQLAIRRNEFRNSLQPDDKQLIGSPGLAYILKKNMESLDMDISKAMPGYKDLESLDALTVPPTSNTGNASGGGSAPKPKALSINGESLGGSKESSLFRDVKMGVKENVQ